jgi:tetratricopeptide (TPR) repeat protein
MLRLGQHRFREAAAQARALTADNGRDWIAFGVLADAETELGDYVAAERAVEAMLAGNPGAAAYVRAGWLRFIAGDSDGAIEATQLAVAASSPADAHSYAFCATQLGALEWSRGRRAAADAAYATALAVLPGYPQALIGRARIAVQSGRPADAIALLAAPAQQNPAPELLWVYGEALAAVGRAGEAEGQYHTLEQIGRRLDERTLSLFLATTGRNRELALELARAELTVRDDIYSEDTLAWALYQNGQRDPARRAAAKALAQGTRDPRLIAHAAEINRD